MFSSAPDIVSHTGAESGPEGAMKAAVKRWAGTRLQIEHNELMANSARSVKGQKMKKNSNPQ